MQLKRLCLLLLTVAPVVQGAYDAEDTLKLNAELAYRYDDNVFRLADNANNTVTKRHGTQADSNVLAAVGGRIDVPVSRQTFYVLGNVSRQQYFKFDELNHTAWTAGLGWDWQAGSQFFGNLSADSSSNMSSFDEVSPDVIDMVRQDGVSWNGNWVLSKNWLLVADTAYRREDHDERQFEDARSIIYGLGLRYVTDKGSSITLRHQWQDYDYLKNIGAFPADLRGYKEQSLSLVLAWPVTQQFQVQASGGYSRWKPNFGGQKSSSTPQGDLTVTWQATGKTRLRAGVGQNFDQFNSGAGRDLERTVFAGANWTMTDKVRWDAEYRYKQRETKTALGILLRDELYDSASLSLVFEPVRSVSLKPFAKFEQRNDQIGKANYKDTQFGLSGRYDF